jgi:hypothetical protein
MFTGGIFLSAKSATYFIALLIDNSANNNTDLNMWAGFSFSQTHVNEDMITFFVKTVAQKGNITVTDCYSLLGSAPYSDTSSNINGNNDI